jgi:transcriptional regulator of acetoin/glycerol metabolism
MTAAGDELCPVCQAKPGDPCTYEHDLFTYSRGPAGRVKRLAHRRGELLGGGSVHKARRDPEQDKRILASWRSPMLVTEIAAAEGLDKSTVYRVLHRHGVVFDW